MILVEKWKKQRRMLTPAFCMDNMKRLFFPIFKEKTDILIKNLNKEVGNTQPFDMLEYISEAVFSTITRKYIIELYNSYYKLSFFHLFYRNNYRFQS